MRHTWHWKQVSMFGRRLTRRFRSVEATDCPFRGHHDREHSAAPGASLLVSPRAWSGAVSDHGEPAWLPPTLFDRLAPFTDALRPPRARTCRFKGSSREH